MSSTRPKIVVLCGSSRFRDAYEKAFADIEDRGTICLTISTFKGDARCADPGWAERHDRLHHAKIAMADEVFIINVGGYIGDSTRREIAYARSLGKPVRWLEEPGETGGAA